MLLTDLRQKILLTKSGLRKIDFSDTMKKKNKKKHFILCVMLSSFKLCELCGVVLETVFTK